MWKSHIRGAGRIPTGVGVSDVQDGGFPTCWSEKSRVEGGDRVPRGGRGRSH